MCFLPYTLHTNTHTHDYTHLRYMQDHNNECVDVFSTYLDHQLHNNNKQLYANNIVRVNVLPKDTLA